MDNFYDRDKCDAITEEGRKQLRHLIDVVWNHVTESEEVPSTLVADKLIDEAFDVPEELRKIRKLQQLKQQLEDVKASLNNYFEGDNDEHFGEEYYDGLKSLQQKIEGQINALEHE